MMILAVSFINSELWIHNENYDLIKEVDKFVPNEKAGLRNDKFCCFVRNIQKEKHIFNVDFCLGYPQRSCLLK